jgi:nucleotide-binding universal stress UspA family protein
MKFFCGVNGSPESLAGVVLAGRMAVADDRLALYYTPPRIEVPLPADGLEGSLRERLARAVLDEALQAVPANLRGNTETLIGNVRADAAMIEAAQQARADLIVLGARGGGPLAERPLGSTAQAVVRASDLPVLVARPTQGKPAAPLRVLLAVDETPASRQAVEFAARLSLPGGSAGKLVSVVAKAGADIPKWAETLHASPEAEEIRQAFDREQAAEVERRREALAGLARDCGRSLSLQPPLVLEGRPAEEILRLIAAEQIDLVVLGARRRSAWSRFLLGSVSDAVLTCASCSVLLVRERAAW